jgi:phytoene desaturase
MRLSIIGGGLAGLSAAAYLSSYGHEVTIFEKNATPGGRARQWVTAEGYVFDMGPSWYWMPDVFEHFFADFGFRTSDFYHLTRLDPAFTVTYGKDQSGKDQRYQIPAHFESLQALFDQLEPGAGEKLESFMEGARFKYQKGMQELVYKPGLSLKEYADPQLLRGMLQLQVFSSFHTHVRKYFKDPRLISLMEFPVLFLGAMPKDTPALYSLMNYAGLMLGTWYPQGGFGKVVDALVQVCKSQGVAFRLNAPVEHIQAEHGHVTGVQVHNKIIPCDAVVAAADYHHVETDLLDPSVRNYQTRYWKSRVMAPSALIYYLGVNKRLKDLNHHTLFFDEDLGKHAREIYKEPAWPSHPLFYVCCPSQTDPGVAPPGHENLFLLMPLAPGLPDQEETRETYYQIMMERLEEHLGQAIRPHVDFKKSYCVSDFSKDYNAFMGNAYGLANTLGQTAILKPKIRNRHLPNLFYAGQLTVPGPGVPPALISGKIAAAQVQSFFLKACV